MKVLVISGFLGAGKTTFIKQLIERTGKYLVILENEYGQTNLDSQDITNTAPTDLKLLEFMEGCVCCTQKDTFSNTILTISAGIDPEYLVVEPTGVGKLSSILAAIDKVSFGKISVLDPVVVLAPRSYEENMGTFGDIYEDQLKYAGTVVLSKIESESREVIEQVTDKIHAINPRARVLSDHYSQMDKTWWDSLLLTEGEAPVVEASDNHDPVDMMEVSITEGYLERPAELIMLLEDILHGEFGLMPRAKGVIKVGGEYLRFDVADRLYAIIQAPEATGTECVFIGRNLAKDKLHDRLNSFEMVLGNSNVRSRRKKM